jgi:hypothetical protein
VERAGTPSRARCDVRSFVRARFLNASFGGAPFGLVDTHVSMASAAMRFAAATGRGNFSAPGNNPARDRAPVAQAALGGRRNALRAALRARSAAPTRFARGGVMPVNAKHTAVPEAQVLAASSSSSSRAASGSPPRGARRAVRASITQSPSSFAGTPVKIAALRARSRAAGICKPAASAER